MENNSTVVKEDTHKSQIASSNFFDKFVNFTIDFFAKYKFFKE